MRAFSNLKRVLFLWVVLLLWVSPAVLGAGEEPGEEPDFRNVRWGMSISDVEKTETVSLVFKDATSLSYRTSEAGWECLLIYLFREDKLVCGSYAFTHSHRDPNDFIQDYENLKGQLAEKYGEPLMARVKWNNQHFRDMPEQWGLAVSEGDLEFMTMWQNEWSMVALVLKGKDKGPDLCLSFYDIGVLDEAEAERNVKLGTSSDD